MASTILILLLIGFTPSGAVSYSEALPSFATIESCTATGERSAANMIKSGFQDAVFYCLRLNIGENA